MTESAPLGSQDLHCHTTWSDGLLPLDAVVAAGDRLGVRMGIADHVSTTNPDRFLATPHAVGAYLDALDAAPVMRAGEFCWCDRLWRDLPDELMQRFDYRIGSNHAFWLPDEGMGSPWWEVLPAPWDSRPHALMDIMVANICDMVRTMPVHIAAHSTLTPPALFDLEDDVEAWWTPEREDRYVDALAASGVALEISNRYRLPHDRLLGKALQAGVRFSLGSDGHTAGQVARLDWAVATATRIGIAERHMFVPQRA